MESKKVLEQLADFVAKFPNAQVTRADIYLHEGGAYGNVYSISLPVGLRAIEEIPGIPGQRSSSAPLAPPDAASAAAEGQVPPKDKKPRARNASSTSAATTTAASAQAAAEAELFGSATEVTSPAKDTKAPSGQTATKSASPSDDDLFGENAAPAKETPKATIEQLRKALTECQTKHGHKDHALGVLKKFTRDGNPTISTLDEAKYQAVIDACASYVPAK